MTIDSLAHDAEVEAEVLRAVAHMDPARAQEFLIALVLKIKRAVTPVRQGAVTLPRLLASTIAAPRESHPRIASTTIKPHGTRTADLVECVRRLGGATSTEVCDALGFQGGERASACATLCSLLRRGILRRDDDRYSLAMLEPDLAAAGE